MDPLSASPLWLSDTPQLGRRQLVAPQPPAPPSAIVSSLPGHLKPGPEQQAALRDALVELYARVDAQDRLIDTLVTALDDLERRSLRGRWRAVRQWWHHLFRGV